MKLPRCAAVLCLLPACGPGQGTLLGDRGTDPLPAVAAIPADDRAGPMPSGGSIYPRVWVNEVLPGNDSVSMDERMDFDDWVELYNPGDEAVLLDGWGLADDLGKPDWQFPDGTWIEPGGHLVVWLDGEVEEGPLHASFSVRTDGDEVALFDPAGVIVDSLQWSGGRDDVVFGRFPSGGAHRSASIRHTPGNPNPVDPGVSRDPSDALFPQDRVVRFDLMLREEAEEALREDRHNLVEGAVAFEGAYLPRVTVKIKGRLGSGRDYDQKAAFKINLDANVPGQRLRGLEHLTFNNMVQDESYVHEMLAYALFRDADVPGSRTAHMQLFINGEYRGLYLHLESQDDQFLKRWFDDPHGNLYEGTYGADLGRNDRWNLGLDEVGANDSRGRTDLLSIYELLESEPTEAMMPSFDRVFDSKRVMRMLAGEAVLSHWDGYMYAANNYRIYHEPTKDNFTLIPWGMDQTFDSVRGIHAGDSELVDWCFQIPSCLRRYDLALVEMSERLKLLRCRLQVDETLELIEPYYRADTYEGDNVQILRRAADDTVDWCVDYTTDILEQLF